MREAFIYDMVRTPMGKRKGGLSSLHPAALLAHALRALQRRNGFDPAEIEDVAVGCVTQTQAQGSCLARQAVLEADWPIEVPGVTLNRFCGSGQQACHYAAQAVISGAHELVVGGGVENMTMVPMGSDVGPLGPHFIERFPNLVPQGLSAEMIADRWGFSRTACDAFALRSQQSAARARDRGFFRREIEPLQGLDKEGNPARIDADQHPRPDTTLGTLAALPPSFKPDGKMTAGNSSGIVDGAAAVLIGSREAGRRLGLRPRAKFRSFAVAGSDPVLMLTGPVPASRKALHKAGLKVADIDVWEINEAFASVPLMTQVELGIPPDRINPNGGAIALGHPLGASGVRLIGTCVNALEEMDARYGLVTMCIGFGMGTAAILDRHVD